MNAAYQVWSSGLEEWEDVKLGYKLPKMYDSHVKCVGSKKYYVFRDESNRWFRSEILIEPDVDL